MSTETMERRTTKLTPEQQLGLAEQVETPLLDGTRLTCPACELPQDILTFIPLEHSIKHASQIVVPLKCRHCRHVFALRP